MNAEALLAQYERIAEAPDAIARLQRFVLDLAVRGKLVPQDARDEPAAVLLKRIAKARAALGLRAASDEHDSMSRPFDLPGGWTWSAVGDVCSKTGSGSTPRGGQAVYKSTGIPFLRSQNVYDDGLRMEDVAYIDETTHARMSGTAVRPRDLLLNITGGSIGRCCRVPDDFAEANVSQHVAILRPAVAGMQDFLHVLIRSPYFQSFVVDEQTGAGRGGLPKNRMDRIAVALPPLAEQHRIVAKVDELMALCGRLEAARTAREATRDRLAAASLARLNTPDPETFPSDARFALAALPALTTRPDQIKQLRQTILNLAVRGKLVPQDPGDEPAAELLKRLRRQRAAITASAKLRAKRSVSLSPDASTGWLPPGWSMEALGNLVDPLATISYGVLVPGPDVDDGVPFIRAQDLALSNHPPRPQKTIAPEIEAPYARTRIRGGEILLCVVGSIGKLGIAPPSWAGANIARAVARIAPMSDIETAYALLVLRSEQGQGYFADATRTLAQPTLNVSLIEALPVPMPPLAEQRRIVAKVDELMSLSDALEASLAAATTARTRLLEATLAEALAPAEARVLEPA
jgi:type I restriction enzyme S subunit